MISRSILQFASIFVALSIFYLSLSPRPVVTASNDKLGHFIAYSVLCLLLQSAFHTDNRRVLLVSMITLLFGFLMEIGQLWVPGRSFSYMDLLANAAGVGIGLLAFLLLKRFAANLI